MQPATNRSRVILPKVGDGEKMHSINDNTMSRLTFIKIMDFIIKANKERVDLII